MLFRSRASNTCLTKQASTRLPGQKLVEPCHAKTVLTTSLWVQQTCRQACARLWVHTLFEPTWYTTLLTWLACTNLPGQKFVEPTWCRLVQTIRPGKLVQACLVQRLVKPTGTKLVQTTVDPASLYKLAGSKVV